MRHIETSLRQGDALIIVDVQNDFCPGGALPIEEGDQVIPLLNQWIDDALLADIPIYVSRDWHPVNHPSFEEQGGPWPSHCLQDTMGARFHPELRVPESAIKITKGVRFDQDQNSVFDQTGLAVQLRKKNIRRVYIGGLAEDVCVLASALDGIQEGFEVLVIPDATRPVTPEGGENARRRMRSAGVRFSGN